MPKDYYLILGVSKEASLHEIKQAYRRIAKKYHPDISGTSNSSDKFLEIQEAYETLMDEAKRRRYNREMANRTRTEETAGFGEDARQTGAKHRQAGPSSSADGGDWFAWMSAPRSFRSRSMHRQADISFEAVLSPREARQGGRFSLILPVQEACWMCRGTGAGGLGGCSLCLGSGVAGVEKRLTFHLPSNLSDGSRLEYPLRDAGVSAQRLVLWIRIDPWL